MHFFITGAAGFIGSNLVDHLLKEGNNVTGYDNLSTGNIIFLKEAFSNSNFKFIEGDILDLQHLTRSMQGCEFVFHFSANADVRFGLEHPKKDLEQNTIGTFNVLESMRINKIGKIAFSSTGSVYGEAVVIPTPEAAPFPIQTSLYGASKLAGEALISAYCEGYGFKSWIFRFVSILGQRYSHGHIFDFYRKLIDNSSRLEILGDGKQKKSYLYIADCISAMMLAIEQAKEKINIFNLGTNEYCEVDDSIRWITEKLSLNPQRHYTGSERGWVGDNPFIFLDCNKIRSLGWEPKYSIREGIIKTLEYLMDNKFLLDVRD
jgi:UDP-glucose 4-epimerase